MLIMVVFVTYLVWVKLRDLPGDLFANVLSHFKWDLHWDVLAAFIRHLVALLLRHNLTLLVVAKAKVSIVVVVALPPVISLALL